jgi:hypothetical protein
MQTINQPSKPNITVKQIITPIVSPPEKKIEAPITTEKPSPIVKNEIVSPSPPIKSIVITDEKIISFFETHFMDPTKFILSTIENYQLSISNKQPNSTEISKNDLLKFQQEYNKFLSQKKSIVSQLKENTKQIESIDFDHLDTILCDRFGIVRDTFTCDICKINTYRNKKALSVHQRKCKRDNEDEDEI